MRSLIIKTVGLVSSVFLSTAFAASFNSPIGYWKTIDDITGKPKSIVQIWKTSDNLLMGKVIKIFPSPGKTEGELCTACKGNNMNQPIEGMVILSGLKDKADTRWDNGKILDPENGKTYSCSMKLADRGNELDVHGYIGMPLLGRSQIWQRVDLMNGIKS